MSRLRLVPILKFGGSFSLNKVCCLLMKFDFSILFHYYPTAFLSTRGGAEAARKAHNLEAGGSNPPPATN